MNVMNAISLVVDSLNDPDRLMEELKQLGISHNRRKIQTIHFKVSQSLLLLARSLFFQKINRITPIMHARSDVTNQRIL